MVERIKRYLSTEGWRQAVGLALFVALGIGIWLTSVHLAQDKTAQAYARRVDALLSVRASLIREDIALQRAHLLDIATSPALLGFVREEITGVEDGQAHARLTNWFMAMLENHANLRQLRVISAADGGPELIRVQQTQQQIVAVPPARLQLKGSRDYVSEALKLPPRAVRISPIELNREQGAIELPQWATYRMSMPMFDGRGEYFGVLVANYDAAVLMRGYETEVLEGLDYFVLNNTDDFLVHPDPARTFGWERGQVQRWPEQYTPVLDSDWHDLGSLEVYQGPGGLVLAGIRDVELDGTDIARLRLILASEPEALVASVHKLRDQYAAIGFFLLLVVVLFCEYLFYIIYRKRQLARASSDYQRIIDNAVSGVMSVTPRGKVLSCNRVGLSILGMPGGQLLGRNLYELMSLVDVGYLDESKLKQLTERGSENTETRVTIGGRQLELQLNAALVTGDEPDEEFYAIIFSDNSDRIALRERIESANEELERQVRLRTEELERARNLAMSANEIKTEFIANISHELRTPLHGIFGTLRLLRQDPLNERQRHRLMLAEESMSELTEIINGIIDVSKLEADRLDIEETDLSLPRLLHDVAQRFAVKAEQKHLVFVADCAEVTDRLVYGDSARISRILANLLDNAINFTDRGQVVLQASTEARGEDEILLHCSVSDSGCGISEEERAKVFEPFFRGNQGVRPETGGVGLGLAIARQLCNLMGGELELLSSAGVGAEFGFTLRLSLVDMEDQPEPNLYNPLEGRTIAVVEPHPRAQRAMHHLLDTRAGQVEVVADAAEIDAEHWSAMDYLVLPLELYRDRTSALAQRLAQRRSQGPLYVLVSAVATEELLHNLDDTLPDAFLLEKPVTVISLDSALLAAEGREPPRAPGTGELSEAESRRLWANMPSISVLVVDDNIVNQKVVGGLLEEYGASVFYADNGQAAIDTLQRKQGQVFDLIIMDCQMPVMDGYEATRRIRSGTAGAQYTNVPIIAITAGAMGGDRMKCLESGMTDYLTKPLQPNALEKQITRHLFGQFGDGDDDSAEVVEFERPEDADNPLATEVRQELRKRPDWDREEVKRRVLGNIEIVNTIIDLYLKSAPEIQGGLRAALAEENFRSLRNLAHDLKGMSENLSARKIAYIAYEIEMAALDRRAEDIDYLLGVLDANCERLETVLQEEVAAAG
ncbi:response regulator [Mangrovimicrobium sediminis]|uniref:histidine kinase n=1 Tax=Mangrovimicrobium sediminis TaxID=2562682 RepID=A0A4Z0LUA5_9GAMM|nr:response regulator [Haliea sp. SAOS-164]TGD70829.1 response regulator [Haliea sp. SAOS-164]